MERETSFSENELLLRIAGGDQKAFNRLFEQYRDRLFHYLLKITKSRVSAEEIVLDVFLKIWTGRSLLTEIDHFEAFLFRVARNKALDFLRSVQKSRQKQMEVWDFVQNMQTTVTADQEMLLAEVALSVQEAVNRLSPQRKMVFQLSREHDLTYEQIGRKLNLSTHTVRNHLAASLQFIRAHLKAEYGTTLLTLTLISHLH